MNDQRTRQICLYGVLAIGFFLPVVRSVGVLVGQIHLHPATQGRLFFKVVYQIVGLLSLYFALRYQGWRLKDIGLFLEPRLLEIGHAFALFFGAIFLSLIPYFALGQFAPHKTYDSAALFGTSVGFLSILFVLLNPFHEELLVRAYLITEIQGLYRSTTLAVILSVTLQTSYHLYQGLPAALSHVPAFLLFSVYYVRTRRILPVILAHMFLDVTALAAYARGLH
ncbi:MAG: CPBP family intramembrane metalloprotease [Acidobacteria bacterium]|nr:CPBP family intramembrane metalloprotease [Acidobacteriota bacterium]